MSLPRKIKLFFFLYISLFLIISSGAGLVLATHDQSQNVSNVNTEQTPSVTNQELIPIPQPTDLDIQPLPTPEEDYEIQSIPFHGSAIKWLVGPIVNAVKTAFTALMDFIFEIITGVSSKDYNIISHKIDLYRNGIDDFSQVPNPGLIDYAGLITNEALDLNIPINSTQYFASINPFAQAQAQVGAENLAQNDIILKTWQRVRNVSYALAAVVLVIIGFMIMLRWRLDPRTVVTIQSALPRVVVALILITFSFAISGLLIDLTRLVTEIVMALIAVPGGEIVTFVLLVVGSIFLLTAIWGPAGLVALVLALILAIIVIVVFVVLIYKLLKRYVTFIILTIFAPLFFLAGALPGGEGIVLNWFKRQAAALLAIPATALFVNLSVAIGFGGTGLNNGFPSPWPVVGPLANILGFTLLPSLVGLGVFFFATKVPDIVDELFGIKEMGARKGIGPGAILGAPIAALRGMGNVNRAAPMLGSLAKSRVGTGGFSGRMADTFYKTAGALGAHQDSFKDAASANIKAKAQSQGTGPYKGSAEWDKAAHNVQQQAGGRAGVESGPPTGLKGRDTGYFPGEDERE